MPAGISIGSTHVFWTNTGDGTIRAANPDASSPTIVLKDRVVPSDIVVVAALMYWVEAGTQPNYEDGTVQVAATDGSGIVTLATAQLDPRDLFVDANAVYWVNRGSTQQDEFNGALMKVALP